MYIILQNVHCVNTYAKIGKNPAETGIVQSGLLYFLLFGDGKASHGFF